MLGETVSRLLDKYFYILALWFVPLSLAYDLWDYVRTLAVHFFVSDLSSNHNERVLKIQRQIRNWIDNGRQTQLCTARPCWKSISLQTFTYKQTLHKIEVDLPNILYINEKDGYVCVEPCVSIGQLNRWLRSRDYMLPVVPELDDLTIGGLVMGGGIESTSHKYGLFQYICLEYELIMGDASIIVCNKDVEPELFTAIPFSYGTLGMLASVKLKIIKYKPWIRLEYVPVIGGLDNVCDEFKRAVYDEQADSIEGIMYTLDSAVIMYGKFVDGPDSSVGQVNRISYWYKPWFYLHVKTFLDKKNDSIRQTRSAARGFIEYVPTPDFLHRHNKSFFWFMPCIIPFGNHWLFRWMLGWAMPPKFSLLKWCRQKMITVTSGLTKAVCQDYGIHLARLKTSLQYFDNMTKIYPIWLCPMRFKTPDECLHLVSHDQDVVFVDVGLYGFSPIPNFELDVVQPHMERYVIDNGDLIALYSETFLSREDMEKMFECGTDLYKKMRKKFNCDVAFPDLYTKISKIGRS